MNPRPFLHSFTRHNVLCCCYERLSILIDEAFNLLADENDVTVVDVRTEVICVLYICMILLIHSCPYSFV